MKVNKKLLIIALGLMFAIGANAQIVKIFLEKGAKTIAINNFLSSCFIQCINYNPYLS